MPTFNSCDPEDVCPYFFYGSLHLDYDSAVPADVSRQNYTVFPREWYIDATFRCSRCDEKFVFTAAEQKHWYEELGFYVDSIAKDCSACRRDLRHQKRLRQEYDRSIETALHSGDLPDKQRLAAIIDELCSCQPNLPDGIHEKRRILAVQIARLTSAPDT